MIIIQLKAELEALENEVVGAVEAGETLQQDDHYQGMDYL